MKQLQSLSHTVWECKYHIVWIPKYRKKVLYGKIREELVGVFHELANRRGCKILEGHLCVDHVHMLLSIPPKYGVAEVVGYLKGKSAIEIAKHFEKVCKITGASFCAVERVAGRLCGMRFQPPAALPPVVPAIKSTFYIINPTPATLLYMR